MNSDQIWKKLSSGVFIIAEAGKNFIQSEEERPVREYLKNAMRLVDAAAEAGADAVKFQTHNVEDEQLNIPVTSPHFRGAERHAWVSRNTRVTPVEGFWKPLKEHCEQRGVVFFSTPMSLGAAKILSELGVRLWKIGSGDILDFVMLDYIRRTAMPIIISSGMSTLNEVEKSVAFLRDRNERVALLHCVSRYPCPPEDLHLKTIPFFKERFDIPIGFSDHSIEREPCLVAVALGATVLEKHFSFSRELWGSDHKVSLTPRELTALVHEVRLLEHDPERRAHILSSDFANRGLGSEEKILQEGEAAFRPLFRKSLVASRDIPAGTTLTANMVYAMRPQKYIGGLPSEDYEIIIGKKTKTNIRALEPFVAEHLS